MDQKYPADRMFLVQFSPETDAAGEQMIGRAEHIESGKKCCFDSLRELEDFVEQVISS